MNSVSFKKFLQFLFFLSLFSPWVVDRQLFFPYVTGSALFFRAVVELLFLVWVIYLILYKKLKPKLKALYLGVIIYLLSLTVATIFSVNPYLSFWGDAERMMGLLGVLHLFVLFFVGASLFKSRQDILRVLRIFIVISFSLAVYGILQHFGFTSIKPGELRIVATVGNAAIFAAYLIFGLGFSLFLAFLSEDKNKYHIFYHISCLVHLIAIFLTATRGAWLGVIGGAIFALFVFLWNFRKRKKILKTTALASLGILVVIILLFVFRNSDFIRDNSYLNRLTSFSIYDNTAVTRFISWRAGWEGFKEKPLLGYGFENFSILFNKHFDPEYYNYAPTQPYFDRAHNIVIELLSTTGIVGFLAYLFLLGVVLHQIFQFYRKTHDYVYLSILGGLFIAYFIQNLFVFDMLPSMLGFMVFLIVVNNWQKSENGEESMVILGNFKKRLLPIVFFVVALLLFYLYPKLIFKPYLALKENVIGQVFIIQDYGFGIENLKKSVSHNTYLDLDIRTVAANTILNYYVQQGKARKEMKDDVDFAINLYEENLRYLPNDVYYNYKIAELLNYRFSLEFKEEFLEQANEHIQKAITHSPGRARLYYILAENYLMKGELEKAIEANKQAVELNDKFGESYWELTKTSYIVNDYEATKENLIKTINLGHKIGEENLISFMGLFNIKEDVDNTIKFYELVIKNGTTNYLYYSTLANLYYKKGDYEKARERAHGAVKLNPDIKESVDAFLENLDY